MIVHFIRVPHLIRRGFPLAVWCDDLPRSKKAQADHRVTGDAANVNCPGCVRIMRETKAQLTAWTPSVEAP